MKCCKCFAEIPDESKFCMKCGAEQVNQEPVSEETESAFIPEDARNLFFPLQGVTLGETTADEVSQMGIEVEDILYDGNLSFKLYWDEYKIFGITFRQEKGKEYVNTMEIDKYAGLPPEWMDDFGITYDMPYEKWLNFFKKYGFSITETTNDSGFFKGLDILYADSADGELQFQFMFSTQRKELDRIYIRYGSY